MSHLARWRYCTPSLFYSAILGFLSMYHWKVDIRALRGRVAASDDDYLPAATEMGSSEKATLIMLEWTRLCGFIADFASTSVGRKSILDLEVCSAKDHRTYICCTIQLHTQVLKHVTLKRQSSYTRGRRLRTQLMQIEACLP